jgi:hypothetical protein
LGDFDEIWYNERSQCGEVHIVRGGGVGAGQLFFKELLPLDVAFSLKSTSSSQLFLYPFGDFDETWYRKKITLCRCSYCKGSPVQLFFKELRPLDLSFSLKNILSSQVLLNLLGDFNET